MGEQPLFSCKAHVFQLEPELKKSWIALSTIAVNVQIFHDPIKNIYRIVSIEGTKALINSIVTPKMTFTKTSQKFGQWIDFKLNLVYGLGFPNDSELNKFVDKFKEIKEFTRSTIKSHERSNSCEITTMNRHHMHNAEGYEKNDTQLKYENDRLKIALTHSTANSRKWEEEIQTLKTNNARLNSALQESNTNLDDWKKQLQYYKEECARLKTSNSSNTNTSLNSNQNYSTNSNKYDEYDEVSSSTSTNSFNNNTTSKHSNQKKAKQELIKLTDSFDKKLKELYDIRESMRKIINDLN